MKAIVIYKDKDKLKAWQDNIINISEDYIIQDGKLYQATFKVEHGDHRHEWIEQYRIRRYSEDLTELGICGIIANRVVFVDGTYDSEFINYCMSRIRKVWNLQR